MRTLNSTPVHADHAQRQEPQSRWRLALLITVLAGFFLMHGLSGAEACVSDALEHSAAQAATVSVTTSAPVASASTNTSARAEAAAADSCVCVAMGALCMPLRPQDNSSLLGLFLLVLAALPAGSAWTQFMTAVLRAARPRSYHGAPVRVLACVSRT